MSGQAADVSSTLEYSLDKWRMDHIPWALCVCLAGLAIVLHLHAGADRTSGAALAIVYLALLGLAFAGWAATTLIRRSGLPELASFPIELLIYVVVAGVIGLIGAAAARSPTGGTMLWTKLVNPPFPVFGWMLLYLGIGWIAVALYLHLWPARPTIRVTQEGIAYHRTWLRDVFIPWPEVHGVGHLEIPNALGPAIKNPNAIAVVVKQDFYEQHIAPKKSSFAPPGSEFMFQPKGTMIQMVLTNPELIVAVDDFRAPIQARWHAYRDRPQTTAPTSIAPPVIYGLWSIDGTRWQAVKFAAPLIALVAVILHASAM